MQMTFGNLLLCAFCTEFPCGLTCRDLWEPGFPMGAARACCSLSGTAACHLLQSWAVESRGQVLAVYLQAQHPPVQLGPYNRIRPLTVAKLRPEYAFLFVHTTDEKPLLHGEGLLCCLPAPYLTL